MNVKKVSAYRNRIVLGEGYPYPYGTGPYFSIGLAEAATGHTAIALDVPASIWTKELPIYRLVLEKKGGASPDVMNERLTTALHQAIASLNAGDEKTRRDTSSRLIKMLVSNDLFNEAKLIELISHRNIVKDKSI